MRRFLRIVKRVVLWTTAVCLTLAVLALLLSITSYFVLRYPPVQERVVRYAEELLGEHLIGDFTIERFESDILSYIDIRGFHAVGKSEYRDSAYAAQITIRYRPTALLFRRVHISSVYVRDVRGHVVMEPGGKIMVPFLPLKNLDENYNLRPPPPREGGRRTRSYDIPKPADWPVRFTIGRSQVEGITGVYRDLTNHMVGEIRNASATVNFHALDSFSVRLRIPEGSYDSPWWTGAIDTIGAVGTVTWTSLEVDSMLFAGSGTRVTASGRLAYFEDGEWDVYANYRTLIRPVSILYEFVDVDTDGVLEGTASYRGKLYEPFWAGTARGRGAIRFHGYNIRGFDVDATYGFNDEYGRARVSGRTAFGDFDVNAALLMKHIMEGPEFGDYSATVELTGLDPKRIAGELKMKLPITADEGSARVRLTGTGLEDIPAAITVTAELGGTDILGGHLSVDAGIMNGDTWDLAGSLGANKLSGKGRVNLLNGTARGTLSADLRDPAPVSLMFANEIVTGTISVSADIEGRLDNPALSASLSGTDVTWRGMRADSLEAYFTVADGSPHLSKANAIFAGYVDSITAYFGHDSIGGYFEGALSIEGGLEAPSVQTRFTGRDLRYFDFAGGHLDGELTMEGKLSAPSVKARFKGRDLRYLDFAGGHLDGEFTAEGDLKTPSVQAQFWGRDLQYLDYAGGQVEGEFSMEGGFENPFVHAHVWGRHLRYQNYGLDEATTVFTFESDTLRWNELRLRHGATLVRSDGRLKIGEDMEGAIGAELFLLDGNGNVRRQAGRLSMSGMVRGDSIVRARCRVTSAPLEIFDPWIPEAHRLKGTLSLFGELSGAIANPEARVNFDVSEPRYYGNRAFTLVGDVRLSDSLALGAVLVRLNDRSDAIEANASLPLLPASGWTLDERGRRPSFFSVSAENFDISAVTGFLEPNARITGATSFGVRVTKVDDDWRLVGSLTLPDGTIYYRPSDATAQNVDFDALVSGTLSDPQITYTLMSGAVTMAPYRMENGYVKGHVRRDTLFIDDARFMFQEHSQVLVHSGTVLYANMDSLFHNRNFQARYTVKNIPSSLFAHLLPDYNMRKGLINGSGTVYADNGRPLLDGNLYLSRLEMTIPDITPSIGPVNAHLRFDGSTANVAAAEAKWGGGLVRANGRFSWDTKKIYDVNLNLHADELSFELPDVVNVGIQNAALQIFDRREAVNIRGNITLAPTSYMRDISIMSALNQMQAGPAVPKTPDLFLQSIRLNVGVDLADNLHVNINLGSVFLDGRVTVSGTADNPNIVGQVTVNEGFVYYLDRKFYISEGTLFNPDQTTLNPTFNIIAKTDVITQSPEMRSEMFTITLTLLGTLESPVVRLSAEPALSELDIFSVLTFGERMGGLGSDISDRLMNIAAHQALGLGARRLEKMLNLDRVSLAGDLMGAGGSRSATLGISKRFTPRLNLSYETNMSNFRDRKIAAQYRLLSNLYLEGQTTGDGENAVDIIFRYSR